MRGYALDEIHHDVAALGRCRDVIKNELVGAFAVITRSQFNRIARVYVGGKSNTADVSTVLYVQARNDAARKHKLAPCRPSRVFQGDGSGVERSPDDCARGFEVG